MAENTILQQSMYLKYSRCGAHLGFAAESALDTWQVCFPRPCAHAEKTIIEIGFKPKQTYSRAPTHTIRCHIAQHVFFAPKLGGRVCCGHSCPSPQKQRSKAATAVAPVFTVSAQPRRARVLSPCLSIPPCPHRRAFPAIVHHALPPPSPFAFF